MVDQELWIGRADDGRWNVFEGCDVLALCAMEEDARRIIAALSSQAPSDDEIKAAAERLLRVSETGPKGRVHDDIVTVARAALAARPAGA